MELKIPREAHLYELTTLMIPEGGGRGWILLGKVLSSILARRVQGNGLEKKELLTKKKERRRLEELDMKKVEWVEQKVSSLG